MICLDNLLSSAHVGAFVKVLEDESLFADGERTAGPEARQRKSNLQALSDKPEIKRIVSEVRESLNKQPLFQRFALPARIGRVLVSRYEPGMTYGAHYDDAFIGGIRTDLSFTVFLSDPDSYSGGELELYTPMGSQALKLPAGCAIVYPSNQLHAVLPVTSGTRLAVVGWVQSRVRSLEARQTLFDLAQAADLLGSEEAKARADGMTRLKLVRNNLLRDWAD